MRLVIVTGMSGAGKSSALKMLEDMGYFCVDNLPIPLLTRFVEMFSEPDEEVKKIALGIDVRGGQDFDGLKEVLDELDSRKTEYEILFLDAQDNVLVKRYKETRRQHPLSGSGRVDTGIAKEREKIMFLKMRATYILDTSRMLYLSKARISATCISRSCPSGSNTASRRIRIWSLTSVFSRILTI